jgi:hypothetical protein
MSNESGKWTTNRLPTRTERNIGILAGIFIGILFFPFSLIALIGKFYILSVIFLAIAIFGTRTAYRAMYNKAELPSSRSVRIVNYIFITVGVCLLLLSPFFTQLSQGIYAVSIGFTGIWVGWHNLQALNRG